VNLLRSFTLHDGINEVGRLNYVLWIQDVVRAHSVGIPSRFGDEEAVVVGVDMCVVSFLFIHVVY
jgi:hypothetical protein